MMDVATPGKTAHEPADSVTPDQNMADPAPHDRGTALGSRRKRAEAMVRRSSYFAAGAGAIPLPGVDLVTIIGVELKMVRDVARVYDVSFDEIKVRAILGSVLGGLLPANAAAGIGAFASTIYRSLPGIGTVMNLFVLPASAAASNYALGQVFIEHFEGGGNFLDLDEKAIGERFRARARKLWRRPSAA